MEADGESTHFELVDTAKSYLTGRRNVIEVSRRVDGLRHGMPDPMDEVFFPFIDLVGDAELFPPDEARHLWSREYLARLDSERSSLESAVREKMIRACEMLVERFGTME